MTVRTSIKDWLSIILLLILIIAVSLAVVWGGISIYANATESQSPSGLPDFPSISKARYTVYFKSTGNVMLTNEYEQPADNIYIIHGYWEIKDGKYRYRDINVTLDKHYFGDIIIKRRIE